MAIDIHKARIFDLASGLGVSLDSATSVVKARTLSIVKKSVDNFRKKFVDSVTPSIYIIDVDKDIINPLIAAYPDIDPKQLKDDILAGFKTTSAPINTSSFIQQIQDAETKANARFEDIKTGTSEFKGVQAVHDKYRRVVEELGRDIGNIFALKVNLLVTDPENLGQPEKVVFIGKSFSGLRDNVNRTINGVLRKLSGNTKASYGSIMAAGHTAVTVGQDFRINTPALTEALFKLEAGGTSGRSFQLSSEDQYVRKVPIFIDSAITFSENFTPVASTLLDIGFSFVVPMDSAVNSLSGSTSEKAALKAILQGHTVPELVDALRSRAKWLASNILNVRNSPNITEYIAHLYASTLKGTVANTYVDNSTSKKKLKLDIPIPKLPDLGKVGVNKLKAPANAGPTLRTVSGQFYSLTSLQSLINTHLQDVISSNMGDGNQTNILNYRTGRFASSVKVERMSQSRNGMITAFYSYMQNPYATFSDGGRQGLPRSRDPKLLIAKSIREIAAEKVGNRMRAVLA